MKNATTTTKETTMTRTEIHKQMKQASINLDRQQLVQTLGRLIQEAELALSQLDEGTRVHAVDLAHNAAKADALAARIVANTEFVNVLDDIADHDINQEG